MHTCQLRGMPYGNGTCDCTAGYGGSQCEKEIEIPPTFRVAKWAQGLIAGGTLLLCVAVGKAGLCTPPQLRALTLVRFKAVHNQ